MKILIDVALVAIIVFCAWRGYKNGIIRGVAGIIAFIIAIYGANIVATAYSSEFTSMLKPFASGLVDKAITEVTTGPKAADEDGEGEIVVIAPLTDEQKKDVYNVSYSALRQLGISREPAEKIAEDVRLENKALGREMALSLSAKLCEILAFVAVFAIVFILISIILAVVGNIINLSFTIPGIEKVDKIVGIPIGILRGIAVVLVIGVIARYFGMAISDEVISETKLLKIVIDSNLIANVIGV